MTELFTDQVDPEKDYTEDLVGEGKKYKSVKDLARAVLEKEKHIQSVETDAKELREELKSRGTLADLLDQIKSARTEPSNGTPSPEENVPRKEEIETLIKQAVQSAVSERDTEQKMSQNFNSVVSELSKQYGSGFQSALNARREEIGLTEAEATELARTKPKAFLKLFGKQETDLFSAPPVNKMNTSFVDGSKGVKNYAYWQKMRKENPNEYFSVNNTRERHQAAAELGEAFYS